MTEAEAIELTLTHIKELFPRNCSACARTFSTFVDYLRTTEPLGHPLSHDFESGSPSISNPSGGMAFSKCPCGATMSLSPRGMPLTTLAGLLLWAKSECDRRGMKPRDFLEYFRWEVRKKALEETPDLSGAAETVPV